MQLRHKTLLYDIANMAYVISDTGYPQSHGHHRVKDICQPGNIDRVARVLGLAYAEILSVLAPVLNPLSLNVCRDSSASPHDYRIDFSDAEELRYSLTDELKLKIKETAHEYMVARVLFDWLGVTLPECADVWKFRMEKALEELKNIVVQVSASYACAFRRPLHPF